MASSFFIYIFILYIFTLLNNNNNNTITAITASPPTIGITYTSAPPSSKAPSPDKVPPLLNSNQFTAVRLPDSDPLVIRSFLYSNISLLLTVPNTLLPAIAANRSDALRWLYTHVVPFYPRSRITTISVGNDILETSPDLSDFLLPAIRNIHFSLRDIGIRKISVSTTFSFINIMTTAYPPSAAEFQEPVDDLLIKPLLQFLEDTNSPFLINVYPYNLYRLSSAIPIGFALFQETPLNFRDDMTTGARYRNLFDMMVDAVISAMAVAGHENIPVIVTETGWPSSGDAIEVDASKVYAEMYLKGLLAHLKSGTGTPLRKEGVTETYIYELFDRDTKQGRNWGVFYSNMTSKYNINFSGTTTVHASGGILMKVLGWLVVGAVVSLLQ